MERFVRHENVKHLREMLERTTDEKQRQKIQQLLDEELRKQKAAGDNAPEVKRDATATRLLR